MREIFGFVLYNKQTKPNQTKPHKRKQKTEKETIFQTILYPYYRSFVVIDVVNFQIHEKGCPQSQFQCERILDSSLRWNCYIEINLYKYSGL